MSRTHKPPFLPALALATVASLAALVPARPAAAITIDPGLAAALAAKDAEDDRVPVLLVFGSDHRVPDDVLSEVQGASPKKRREQVLAALKKKMKSTANGAMSVLANPAFRDQVGNLRELYMSGALSFEADADLVARLGMLPDEGTMFHDNARATYDAVRAEAPAGGDKLQPAATDTAWGVKWVGAHKVWSQLGFDGTGVVVGHIDTGVWLAHPDLAGGIRINPGEINGNGIDDDANGYIDDWRGWDFGDGDNNPDDDSAAAGHGTHTAGTVVGDGTGAVLTGVAPGAKLLPCKVWNSAGLGGSLGTIWAAQQYCVENGARIITMSLGFPGAFPAYYLRAERDNCANIRDAGVLLVNSAGNDHDSYDPPLELGLTARVPAPWNPLPVPWSNLGGVVTVGGTGYKSNVAYTGSSWGPAKWDDVDPFNDWPYSPGAGLTKPDIAAPGTGVNSTTIGGGYSGDTWSGTSMACPHIAGVAALMLQKNPSLSPAGLDSLIETTALDLGTAGKDNVFGSGQVNALAAVQAASLSQLPDIVWQGALPDPTGDRVLDAGQLERIAFSLYNASATVPATGITLGLAVEPNAYVTVSDGAAAFPNLAPGGIVGNNILDPLWLSIAAGAPQGFPFTMHLTVQAAGGFQRTFDVEWYVGLPEYRTHDLGGLRLTVTDQGIIGYMSDAGTEGAGLGYRDFASSLYVGSFWAGTDINYVCNRDYSGGGTETYEWRATTSPNGRVQDLGAAGSDQTFHAIFSDAGHAAPRSVVVEQTSFAFDEPADDRFVILEYRLKNNGAIDMPEYYNGVYCDFDIVSSMANLGGTDAGRKLAYVNAVGGPYYGIALLGGTPAVNLTMMANVTYVYPTLAVEDTYKLRHLRGTLSTPVGGSQTDWSALVSSVVDLPPNGGEAVVAYAIVYGATLADLQEAAEAANQAYSPVAPVTGEVPFKVLRLAQNHPNPFNPRTEIAYTVERDGHVLLEVLDLAGRRVRTLVNEQRAAGDHAVAWDGLDDAGNRAASGAYICRMSSGGGTASRKMTLVK